MSFFGRFGLAAMAVLLACSAVSPVSLAQSRSIPQILQMNTSGSYLGIRMEDVTAANMSKYKLAAEKGVIVRSVENDSPAAEAKLQENDVILEYGGLLVWSSSQFARMVEETPSGRKVELAISRDGKRMNLTAEIGKRGPDERSFNERDVFPDDRNALPRDFFRVFPFRSPDRSDRLDETRKPRLGVTLQPVTDQLAEYFGVPGKKGALVSTVVEGSASAGKLKSGDVVIQADGREIAGPDDLIRVVNDKSKGSLSLKVVRDKKEITVVVNLPDTEESDRGIKL